MGPTNASIRVRATIVWIVLAAATIGPIAAAAWSPLVAWRGPAYIVACFAGIAALCLLLFQPLLASGMIPGISRQQARTTHQWVGGALVLAVVAHVGGLWITSPPDVIDALLLRSPTPFSAWGVIAMWALFISAAFAAFRMRLRIGLRFWRLVHRLLATVIVGGTVVHALLIEGMMETVSKAGLCLLVLIATLRAMARVTGSRAHNRAE
ncbi:MAG: ferric reductase-like transmembrane domain-containing protein [Hoeflea sp.]|uniref:ferric reductase-like transmembrane domain-containing protein n=1 Tax=Hoeflea sp. TaxID=1940281 RepID=UPI0032EC8521